MPYYL